MQLELDAALRNDLIELIAANFKTGEVNELGRLVLGCFDSNEAAGTRSDISLSARKCAGILVDCCERGRKTEALLKLVVEVDNGTVQGRPIRLAGLEDFLGKLTRGGIHYDFRTRRILAACRDPQEMPNWGCLKEGKEYETSVLSIDVVGNSEKVRRLGTRLMEKVYVDLRAFLREILARSDGRIWSWAGDGGIVAFALRDHAVRAVRFALEVQSTVPVFNLASGGEPSADITLRIGVDTGRVKFSAETGSIVSDVITTAVALEKNACAPGMVAVSRAVFDSLPPRMASLFRAEGRRSKAELFRTSRRLDGLLGDLDSCLRPA